MNRKTKRIVLTIIKEMQRELDSFFRSKKTRKVQLTSEDILYLEVMLAQAVGPMAPRSIGGNEAEGLLNAHASRFLADFFTLKTKPQVQLKADSFSMVRKMVDRTISVALEQVKYEETDSDGEGEGDEIVVPSTPSTISTESTTPWSKRKRPLSPSESLVVVQETSPLKHPFKEFKEEGEEEGLNQAGSWLKTSAFLRAKPFDSPVSTDYSLPDSLRLLSSPTEASEGAVPDAKLLPLKKRRLSLAESCTEAMVPAKKVTTVRRSSRKPKKKQ